MITIDLKTGELKIGQFRFSSKTEISYLNESLLSSDVELWSSNDIWKSYRLFKDKLVFILLFKNKLLQTIHICQLENEEGGNVSNIITQLGGEQEYLWGKIELNDDKKGGFISVLIKYF